MKNRFNPFLIFTSFMVLAACGQKSDIQEGSATFGSAQKKGQAEAQGEAQTEILGPAATPNPEPAAEEEPAPPIQPSLVAEEPAPEALPPVSVSGAYLSCRIAANELQLACQVMDSNAKAMTFNDVSEIEFSFLMVGEVATTFTTFQTSTAGTFFYVNNRDHRTTGFLVFRIRSGLKVESLNFPITPLYVPGLENVRQAVAVERFGTYIFTLPHSSSGRLFGDGNFANENDSCLSLNGANRAKASSFVSTVDLSKGNSQVDLFMDSVCGLQTNATSIVMRGPGLFKPLRVFLVPESPNLMIAQRVAMPDSGNYTVELDHKTKTMPNDSLDDFSFGNLKWGVIGEFSSESNGMKIVP